ncbi:hypothetical protein GCM10009765_58890 [Fodinicola feengrottensis]|uniref:Uncharacterized protein n=1 Tax=Fodinicola feengrottensis TaxID=435914 RepID=A0ABN2IAX7_9ACTN
MKGRQGVKVEDAVLHDLQRLSEDEQNSALAQAALTLARGLDAGYDKGSETAAVARELRNYMADLLANATTAKGDGVDDIAVRRAARLAKAAGS